MLVQFTSVVLPWKCRLNPFAESCFAALLSTFLFGVLDAVGLKMLWWTWHNSDPLYADRYLGVPVVSAFWIMVSTGALNFCIRSCVDSKWVMSSNGFVFSAIAIISGPFATVGVMNLPFMVFYHPIVTYLGYPASLALGLLRAFSLIVVLRALWSLKSKSFQPLNSVSLLTFTYISIFLGIAYFGQPELVQRTSFAQPFGPCDTMESSFWGAFQRHAYVCADGIVADRDHYSLSCLTGPPAVGSGWYTVCGVPTNEKWWLEISYYFVGAYVLVALAQLHPQSAQHAKTS